MYNGACYLTHSISASVGSVVHTNEKEVCCGQPCFCLLWVNLVSLGRHQDDSQLLAPLSPCWQLYG